jgi:peptidoglycan/xylan/chitin deacetylase (PgdA/CDA1 family)
MPAAVGLPAQIPSAAPQRAVALTFDDLPVIAVDGACDPEIAREVTREILDALTREEAPAMGFVNASRRCGQPVDALRDPVLEAWLDAGHDLGNRTWSHPDIVYASSAGPRREERPRRDRASIRGWPSPTTGCGARAKPSNEEDKAW